MTVSTTTRQDTVKTRILPRRLAIRGRRWYNKLLESCDDRGDRLATLRGIDCVVALKALAEETRLRILQLLLKEPLSVNDISERLDVSQYNISKHLRTMREAGLLKVKKQGRQHLYLVTPNLRLQVAANRNILDLGCCTFELDKLPS